MHLLVAKIRTLQKHKGEEIHQGKYSLNNEVGSSLTWSDAVWHHLTKCDRGLEEHEGDVNGVSSKAWSDAVLYHDGTNTKCDRGLEEQISLRQLLVLSKLLNIFERLEINLRSKSFKQLSLLLITCQPMLSILHNILKSSLCSQKGLAQKALLGKAKGVQKENEIKGKD